MDAEPVRPGRREVCTVDRCVVGVDIARVARGHRGGEVLDRPEPDAGQRRELHEAVDRILDAARQSLEMAGMVDREDMQATEAVVARTLLPAFDRRRRVLDVPDAIEDEQRPTVDRYVPRVVERRENVVVEPVGPALAVALSDENIRVEAVPAPRPVLVRPAQRERELDRRVVEQVAQRRVEELPPVEPVVVHDESVDSVLRGQSRLAAHHIRIRQVVSAQLSRLDRLRVPVVEGAGAVDVRPVGEPCPPPGVVLGDLMELREVEGEHLGPPGWPPPRAVQPRRDVVGLDDIEARRGGRDAHEALERVRGGSVDVTRLRLEMLRSEPKIRQPAENPRPCPEHRAGRVAQHVRVEGEGDSRCERLDEHLVRAPRLRPTDVPGRDDEPHRAIACVAARRCGECPPARASARRAARLARRHRQPVRAALRMHLEIAS